MMEKVLAVFFGLIAISSATVLPCAAGKGSMPKSVVIQDCDANERCSFTRGRSFKADVQFTALSELRTMTPQVNVTIGGIKGETDLPSDRYEACNWLLEGATPCPIPAGKDTTWRLNIPVVLTDPLVQIQLEASLFGPDGKPQFCFVVLGQIVAF